MCPTGAIFADELRGASERHHGQPPPRRRNGVALSRVSLLSNTQRFQLRIEGGPLHCSRRCKLIDYAFSSAARFLAAS